MEYEVKVIVLNNEYVWLKKDYEYNNALKNYLYL